MPRKPRGITEKRAIKENIEEARRMLPLQRRAFRLNKKAIMPLRKEVRKMSIACKYCIATKGFSFRTGQLFETEDELVEHIEMEHDIPVERPSETEEETMRRFKVKNPRAGGPDCQCPACLHKRGDRRADIMALVDKLLPEGTLEGKNK